MNINFEDLLNKIHDQVLKTGEVFNIEKFKLPTYTPYTSRTQPLETLSNMLAVPATAISIGVLAATVCAATLMFTLALIVTAPANVAAGTLGRVVLGLQEGKKEEHSNTKQALNVGKNAVYGSGLMLGAVICVSIVSTIVSALSAVVAAASLLLAAAASFAYGAEMIVRTTATGGKAAMSFFKSTAAKDHSQASTASDSNDAGNDDDEDFEMDSKSCQAA